MTNWMQKTLMEMSVLDEICEFLCISIAIAVIGFVGWLADRLEEKWNKRKNKRG